MSQFQHNFIATIIDRYGLELDGHQVDTIIADWLQKYDRTWIVKAMVESLYRGRYKIKSIDNILRDWQRLGKPRYNFTPEYEREILQNLPDLNDPSANSLLTPIVSPDAEPTERVEPKLSAVQQPIDSKDLDPEQSAPFQYHNSLPTLPLARLPQLVFVGAETDNLEDARPADSTAEDRDNADPALTPLSSNSYQRGDSCHGDRHPEPTISPPAKLQLFKTLKAIVEPKYQYRQEVPSVSICPLLSAENNKATRIAQFKFPIETMSEERQL
jgi:hypothetical protein